MPDGTFCTRCNPYAACLSILLCTNLGINDLENPDGDNDEDEYGESSVDSEYGDYGYDD